MKSDKPKSNRILDFLGLTHKATLNAVENELISAKTSLKTANVNLIQKADELALLQKKANEQSKHEQAQHREILTRVHLSSQAKLKKERTRRQKIKRQNSNRFVKLKQYLWEAYGMLEFAPAKHRQAINEAIVPSVLKADKMTSVKSDFMKKVTQINEVERSKPKSEQRLIYISAEQERMLFSSNTATNIIAGAGSGKSTTLILRIIMMNKIMDIGLDRITVCTFTRESRKDFIENLRFRFKQFGKTLTHKEAKNIVRTFHSLAYEIHTRLGDGSKSILFDYESQKPKEDDPYGENVGNQMQPFERQLDEPSVKLEMMMEVYKSAYSDKDPTFRKITNELFQESLRQEVMKNVSTPYSWIKDYTDELSDFCLSDWLRKHPSLLNTIEPYLVKGARETVDRLSIKYNLYLKNSNIKVFLSIKNTELKGRKVFFFNEQKHELQGASFVEYYRRYALLKNGKTNCLIVYRIEELLQLIAMEEFDLSRKNETLPIPDFTYLCAGDKFSSNSDQIKEGFLVTQFEKIIDYSYAINVPLYCLTDKQMAVFGKRSTEITYGDRLFINLARLFHIAWIKHLQEKRKVTFDDVFYTYGSSNNHHYADFDFQELGKLQHLMIDEFQDISPVISKFINQLKKQLNKQQTIKDGSIMSVGDDCQSIYGWRGSSPNFILNYKSCFDLFHDESEYPLENNYRCTKLVTDLGDKIIDRIPKLSRKEKKIYATGANAEAKDALVRLNGPIDIKDGEFVDFELAHIKLEEEAMRDNISQQNPIYLLCTKKSLYSMKSKTKVDKAKAKWCATIHKLKKKKLLKVFTVHSAKGLEAHTVFFIGDATEPEKHPIRATLCRFSDIRSNYYQAQKEEQLRLAYVAVTRAKNRLYWFAESLDSNKNLLSDLFK